MKFFYHNVGLAGATVDFPKTVFTDLPISFIEENVSEDILIKSDLIESLRANFPDGFFNCWGVPQGAAKVIRNLSVGDAVILVESIRKNGLAPALCLVKTYINFPLLELSNKLWGSAHYPYIFFFKTEELNSTWRDIQKHLGYETYRPPGLFLSIADARLETFGGAQGYLKFLRQNHSSKPQIVYSILSGHFIKDSPEKDKEYQLQLDQEMDKLVYKAIQTKPVLKSGLDKISIQTTSAQRLEAFRKGVRRIYGSRCVICGISIKSPDGKPETQSAHIFPKEHDGSDDLRNGICLCHMHHWAFDEGWISLGDNLTILVKEDLPSTKDYDFIRNYAGNKAAKPIREELAPHPIYLSAHRELHGFNS